MIGSNTAVWFYIHDKNQEGIQLVDTRVKGAIVYKQHLGEEGKLASLASSKARDRGKESREENKGSACLDPELCHLNKQPNP